MEKYQMKMSWRDVLLFKGIFLKSLMAFFVLYFIYIIVELNYRGNAWTIDEAPVVDAVRMLAAEKGGATYWGNNVNARLPLCKSDEVFSPKYICNTALPGFSYVLCPEWIYNPYYKETCVSIRVDESVMRETVTRNFIYDALSNTCDILQRNDGFAQFREHGCHLNGSEYERRIKTIKIEVDGDSGNKKYLVYMVK